MFNQIYDFVSRVAHWCETTDFIEAYTFFGKFLLTLGQNSYIQPPPSGAMSDVQNVNYLDKMMNDGDAGPNALGQFMLSAY